MRVVLVDQLAKLAMSQTHHRTIPQTRSFASTVNFQQMKLSILGHGTHALGRYHRALLLWWLFVPKERHNLKPNPPHPTGGEGITTQKQGAPPLQRQRNPSGDALSMDI